MNNWLKAGLIGAAGAGLLAATGGTAGGMLGPLLSGAGEGAAAGGTAAATGATAGAATGATAGAVGGATAAVPAAATAYVTPSVTGGLLSAESATAGSTALDAIAASQPGYAATGAGLDAVAASQPGYAAGGQALNGLKAGGMLSSAGKAASAYGTVQNTMGANQQQHAPAPQGRPIFQGETPQFAPIAEMGAPQNQFAQMLAQRQRGMLG
jgi:hypothetical protein